jgi:hypothetical protein
VHSVFRRCKVTERAGNTDARVTRYYAQLYERASDEDVDVAGAIVKRTRIYDTIIKSIHVDPDCQPVDPTATQIDNHFSGADGCSKRTRFGNAPNIYCTYNYKRCNQGGLQTLYGLNQCPHSVKEGDRIPFSFPDNVPGLCERLDEQVACCLLLQSIETPASRRMSRPRDGSQNFSQLRTIILSSFLDNSPCKAFQYFEPRVLRFSAWP